MNHKPPPPYKFQATIKRDGDIDVTVNGESDHRFLRTLVDVVLNEAETAGTDISLSINPR